MAPGKGFWSIAAILALAGAVAGGDVFAAKKANVRASKHNLSAVADGSTVPGTTATVPARDVKAVAGQDPNNQVCVYCHTPHGATSGVTPLWNRQLSSAVYTGYTSKSLDAIDIQQNFDGKPDGSSKLCLACHDGTIAVGAVNVLNGRQPAAAITMTGANQSAGKIIDPPSGTAGYTRYIGTDLSNDHPISVAYTSALATRDGELRDVGADQKYPTAATGTAVIVGRRSPADKPKLPLEKTAGDGTTGEVQCATCHDPHLVDDAEVTVGNQKFLRLNRFQENQVVDAQGNFSSDFDATNDIICLACHDKNIGSNGTWAASAHANKNVVSGATNSGAAYTYNSTAATLRGFPANQPVWKAACLNCHDTHTAPGARRLLRGGVSGGASAIEETCYQCHTTSANSALNSTVATSVPDIRSDFTIALPAYRMPITTADQGLGSEVHDIGLSTAFGAGGAACLSMTGGLNGCGKDFIEDRTIIGSSRHVECTDCHNPHRVMKKQCFNGGSNDSCTGTYNLGTPDNEGTHRHASTTVHSNLASGALRGAWGIEPKYSGGESFHTVLANDDYDVKRGDPPPNASTAVGSSYVTREYQICLKCHSSYAYGATPPLLDANNSKGKTPSGTNGVTRYSDQAREFQAPTGHQGESINMGCEGGAWNGCATAFPTGNDYDTNNHRGWHPVIGPTGRSAATRGSTASNWLGPFSNAVGTQTMYCTDCHGTNTAAGTAVPSGTAPTQNPWGPHGSTNPFLLKGRWGNTAGNTLTAAQSVEICTRCHASSVYQSASGGNTGFTTDSKGDGHAYHNDKVGALRCYWCHVAVPHGWKNKQLLVNLNDVGNEVGINPPIQVATNYTNPPYYFRAYLKIKNFRVSNTWSQSECGPRSGTAGKDWMTSNCTPSN